MKTKLIFSIIISIFLSIDTYSQVENEELDYDSIHVREKKEVKIDPRADPTRKICDPNAKISQGQIFKIGNLEVMKNDLLLFGEYDKMWFTKAEELCKSLGNGWRLPTRQEILKIYHKRWFIGGFKNSEYWFDNKDGNCGMQMRFDSEGKNDDGADYLNTRRDGLIFKFTFYPGCEMGQDDDGNLIGIPIDAHVRAVRNIK